MLEKINDYFIKKAVKHKLKPLFLVRKKVLFDRIHELSSYAEQLEFKTETLQNSNKRLRKALNNQTSKYTSKDKTSQQNKPSKAEMAYQGLLDKYEKLQEENNDLKLTLNTVDKVIDRTQKQNNYLKETNDSLTKQNEGLRDTVEKLYAEKNKEPDIRIIQRPVKEANKAIKLAR